MYLHTKRGRAEQCQAAGTNKQYKCLMSWTPWHHMIASQAPVQATAGLTLMAKALCTTDSLASALFCLDCLPLTSVAASAPPCKAACQVL